MLVSLEEYPAYVLHNSLYLLFLKLIFYEQ